MCIRDSYLIVHIFYVFRPTSIFAWGPLEYPVNWRGHIRAGLPMMHSLHIFDALEPIFNPFKSVLCVELTL